MILTTAKPISVGDILREEFLEPLGINQTQLAAAMGVPRKHVNELCNDRRAVTVDTAFRLSRTLGTTAEFWLNTQRRWDMWHALNDPERRARIEQARPLPAA